MAGMGGNDSLRIMWCDNRCSKWRPNWIYGVAAISGNIMYNDDDQRTRFNI